MLRPVVGGHAAIPRRVDAPANRNHSQHCHRFIDAAQCMFLTLVPCALPSHQHRCVISRQQRTHSLTLFSSSKATFLSAASACCAAVRAARSVEEPTLRAALSSNDTSTASAAPWHISIHAPPAMHGAVISSNQLAKTHGLCILHRHGPPETSRPAAARSVQQCGM